VSLGSDDGFRWIQCSGACNPSDLIIVADYSTIPQHSSGYKKAEEDANKEAEAKLQEIQAAGNEKGGKVVDDLINAVVDVKPQASDKIKA
jgi:hypothetical protein